MNPTEPEKEINRIERELDAISPPAGKPPIKRGGQAVRPENNKSLDAVRQALAHILIVTNPRLLPFHEVSDCVAPLIELTKHNHELLQ